MMHENLWDDDSQDIEYQDEPDAESAAEPADEPADEPAPRHSLIAIKNEIAASRARAAYLETMIEEAHAHTLASVKDTILGTVADNGLELEEVLRALRPDLFKVVAAAKRRQTAVRKDAATKAALARTHYRDTQTGHLYKGGKMPLWLAKRLVETGLALDEYRDAYMTKAA